MTMTNPGGVMPGDVQIEGTWYIRSFVSELEPGDVNSFGETVRTVSRITDERCHVIMENGSSYFFSNGMSTMLVVAVEGVDTYA